MSNMPICEVGRGGERKKPEREEKEEEEGSGRKVGAEVKTQARRQSPWRRARVTGAELPAMSPPRGSRAQELSARDAGAEMC